MKNTLVLLLAFMTTSLAFAGTDLNLNGEERWEAKFTGYICGAFQTQSDAPFAHSDYEVNFEFIRTDYTLDNGLIKATFKEDGTVCSYTALLHADNAASTISLVKSKAFATAGESSCLGGKAVIDEHLSDNEYLYWGHPHHVTVMMPVASAQELCGEGSTHVGLDFTVSKFLGKR